MKKIHRTVHKKSKVKFTICKLKKKQEGRWEGRKGLRDEEKEVKKEVSFAIRR